MASLKQLEIINKNKLACLDEPKTLPTKPLSVKAHLRILNKGQSGLDLPELDIALAKKPSAEEQYKKTKEKEDFLKSKGIEPKEIPETKVQIDDEYIDSIKFDLLNREQKEFFVTIPKKYESEAKKYYNRLKQILKRIFDSVLSLKDTDLVSMYKDMVEIVDGISRGGAVTDIIKRKHLRSMGVFCICVSVIIILLKLIYSPLPSL